MQQNNSLTTDLDHKVGRNFCRFKPRFHVQVLFASIGTIFFYCSSVNATTLNVPITNLDVDDSMNCVTFDSEERIITITCKTSNLSEISTRLIDQDVLLRDGEIDKGWVLNAGITIAENATLHINSTDTSWLKIVSDGETAHPITVLGSLKIDSVKLTSWDPILNNYATSQDSDRNGEDVKIGSPRPYIVVENEATGTTDITNSELAYMGYEAGYGEGRTGLRYEGGEGSIVSGNNIHDLYFAFYSRGVGDIKIENNHIHNNIHYGLDPHTGTHDMIIRNNTIHDNGSIGIICSVDCYNIVIVDNKAYNNTNRGIMFSTNMSNSIARNNIVDNENNGIVISESNNNEIHNNIVSNSGSGIDIDEDSFGNTVYNNTMINIPGPSEALYLRDGASEQNMFHNNTLISITGDRIILD